MQQRKLLYFLPRLTSIKLKIFTFIKILSSIDSILLYFYEDLM